MVNSYWTASPFNKGSIGCTETSVRNHLSTLRKIPKDCRSHLYRSASLKSRVNRDFYHENSRINSETRHFGVTMDAVHFIPQQLAQNNLQIHW
jgi:hypothetical protein